MDLTLGAHIENLMSKNHGESPRKMIYCHGGGKPHIFLYSREQWRSTPWLMMGDFIGDLTMICLGFCNHQTCGKIIEEICVWLDEHDFNHQTKGF